jgi:hypothetical protein
MTTSSAFKDNPKTGKKGNKQQLVISSSLKSIMKYGGSGAVGGSSKDKSKRMQLGKSGEEMTEGPLKRERSNKEGGTIDEDGDRIMVNEAIEEDYGKGKGKETEVVESEGKKMKMNMADKWDDPLETMDIDSTAEVIATTWEKEVTKWETELAKTSTPEHKAIVEDKLKTAQVMLKESLLKLAINESKGRNEEENPSTVDGFRSRKDEEIDLTMLEEGNDTGWNDGRNSTDVGRNDVQEHDDRLRQEDFSNKEEMIQKTKGSRVLEDYNWGDISDDDTVAQHNQEEIQWKLVSDKKHKKDSRTIKHNNKDENSNNNHQETKNKQEDKGANQNGHKHYKKISDNNSSAIDSNNNKSSLTSYLEITKDKMRGHNKTAIRITMSFTPRTSGAGELTRIAKELLSFGREIDKDILLLPWEQHSHFGPINLDDMANPTNLGENIRKYFFKPYHVNFQPGSPAYGIGLHLSTNLTKHEFLSRWNLKKQEYKQNNRAAYSIAVAPMQKSPNAFIIGIAVGSTEKQDYEILNQKLSAETGIDGIEVSFQNINQAGVTQEFWKYANEKAVAISKDKYSRDHLREKFRWAPNALAIYVPTKDAVNAARKIMLHKYGKPNNGGDPVWPDGSSMRFLPIKGPTIKNEKTRSIVRKRLAYHIWLKANEAVIDTNFVNIHQTIDAFQGLTFSEIVLQTVNEEDERVFSHFNRSWSNDPGKERWSLSVKPQIQDSAIKVFNDLRETLFDKYGSEITKFFLNPRRDTGWRDIVVSTNQYQDDEDDWFDEDDDIDDIVKKGLVDSNFIQFFGNKPDEDDKASVASWGTGNTAYTEIVTSKDTGNTGISSITQESGTLHNEEIEKRKDIVKVRLLLRNIPEAEVDDIMQQKAPFDLAFSGVHLPTWDAEKEVLMISVIREQYNLLKPSK